MIHSAVAPVFKHRKSQVADRGSAAESQKSSQWPEGWHPAYVLEMLPYAVVVLDATGRVSGCNPAAHELLGAPLVGEPWQGVVQRAFAPQDNPLATGPFLRDGRRIRVATRALAPQPGQIVLLSEDAEAAGEQPLASAAETAAVLAHQIRTPLAAAVLFAGHLMRPLLETQDRLRIAGKLRAALGHLERLVNDILLYARAGRVEKRPLALAGLIDELRELVEPWLCEQDCRITWPQQTPPVRLLAQRDALLSALENLIVNAVEACGRGARLALDVRTTGAGAVECVLSDNGPGVPAGLEARIFEPFFTTRANGTGLGLAVARAVARAHGGEICYAPRAGGGATFTLRMPIDQAGVRS